MLRRFVDDSERLSQSGKGTPLCLARPRVATIAKQNKPRVARAEACLAGDATPPLEDDLEVSKAAPEPLKLRLAALDSEARALVDFVVWNLCAVEDCVEINQRVMARDLREPPRHRADAVIGTT